MIPLNLQTIFPGPAQKSLPSTDKVYNMVTSKDDLDDDVLYNSELSSTLPVRPHSRQDEVI